MADNVTTTPLMSLASMTGNETTWLTHENVEHFLGDPDVDHALALLLGIVSIVYGRRLPQLLAVVSSVSLGLWVGLVVQDRQAFGEPLWQQVKLPQGQWVPIVAGVMSGVAAAVLCKVAWKAALVLLTAGIVMLMALSICRLANVSPDRVFSSGASLLSAYRVVGAVVLIVSIFASAIAVHKLHGYIIEFASAFLGSLLLLSAISHFAARVGNEAPFSLLDDLARIFSEVRSDNCHLWDTDDAHHLEKCNCEDKCQTEICAWLASSVTVLVIRWLKTRLRHRRELLAKRASDEERAPLSQDVAPSPAAPEAPVAEPGPRSAGSAKRAGDGARLMAADALGLDETPRAGTASPDASPAAVSPQTLGASAER